MVCAVRITWSWKSRLASRMKSLFLFIFIIRMKSWYKSRDLLHNVYCDGCVIWLRNWDWDFTLLGGSGIEKPGIRIVLVSRAAVQCGYRTRRRTGGAPTFGPLSGAGWGWSTLCGGLRWVRWYTCSTSCISWLRRVLGNRWTWSHREGQVRRIIAKTSRLINSTQTWMSWWTHQFETRFGFKLAGHGRTSRPSHPVDKIISQLWNWKVWISGPVATSRSQN